MKRGLLLFLLLGCGCQAVHDQNRAIHQHQVTNNQRNADQDARLIRLEAALSAVATLGSGVVAGPRGLRGPAGKVGPAGPIGRTGEAGPRGPRGPSGANAAALCAGGVGVPVDVAPGGAPLVEVTLPGLAVLHVAGQPYRGVVTLQWLDPALGGDHPGAPSASGRLSLDVVWEFAASALAGSIVRERGAVEVEVDADGAPLTLRFEGLVPTPPETPGGLRVTHLSCVRLMPGDPTTTQGLASVALDLVFDLQTPARNSQ